MLTAAPTPCAEAVGELGEDPPSEQEPWRPWTTCGEEAVSPSPGRHRLLPHRGAHAGERTRTRPRTRRHSGAREPAG